MIESRHVAEMCFVRTGLRTSTDLPFKRRRSVELDRIFETTVMNSFAIKNQRTIQRIGNAQAEDQIF